MRIFANDTNLTTKAEFPQNFTREVKARFHVLQYGAHLVFQTHKHLCQVWLHRYLYSRSLSKLDAGTMLFLAPPEIQEHCERDSIYTTSATPKTKRSHIAAIPTEILRKIIKYVEDPCYPVKSLFMVVDWLNHEYEPELALYSSQSATQLRLYAKLSRNLGKYDLSILDAMQVCRVWRDVVLEVIFGGDTRKWSNREWNQKLARLQEAREWNEKFLDTSKTTNREVRHREQPSKRRKAQPGFDTAVARKNCFTDYCVRYGRPDMGTGLRKQVGHAARWMPR